MPPPKHKAMPSYNIQDGNEGFKKFKAVGTGNADDPYVPVVGIQVVPDVDADSGWNNPLSDSNIASEKLIKETIDNQEITAIDFNTDDGVLTISKSDGDITVNMDGRYTNVDKHVTNASFNTNTGVLTLTFSDSSTVTVDLNLSNSGVLSNITNAGSGEIITGTERTKLSGIETNATADQTDAEIKIAYENNTNTNAYIDSDKTKLDGIQDNADVTDATNVDASGAVMNTDTTTVDMDFVIDENDMSSDSNSKIPTQQSVKAYVDSEVSSALSSEMTYKGGYDASANTPDLDTSPIGIEIGDMYTVTVAGQFYTEELSVGDVLISETNNASSLTDWTIVSKSLDATNIKTLYESNTDTNAFTDSDRTKLTNIEDNAQVNIKSDWNETDDTSNSFIQNKPTTITSAEQDKLGHISVTQAVDLDQMEIDISDFESRFETTMTYKGAYDASANTPDLDTSPSGIEIGDTYTVSVDGTFYTESVIVGDLLIAETDNPSSLSDWTIAGKGSDATNIKTAYESNADTNAFTDDEQTKLTNIENNAQVNINPDWGETSAASDAFIQNKPTVITSAERDKLSFISVTEAVNLNQLNDAPIAPTDNSTTDAYFYFGWSSKDGGWLVRRQTRSSGLLERADVSNNSTITAYADAWDTHTTLTWGGV